MVYNEKKQKADEIVAFLSAWGITKQDASDILAYARNDVLTLHEAGFKARGEQLNSFMQLITKTPEGNG